MISVKQQLQELSSAEEFFAFLKLDYDPRILASSRLHILKRFHDLIDDADTLETLTPDEQRAAYRERLSRAYGEFQSAPALTRNVFPRLAAIHNRFVPLATIGIRGAGSSKEG